jgi:hypothetical protein
MKAQEFILQRYDADNGKVFDWKEPRFDTVIEIVDGEEVEKQVEAHLYAKTLFIGYGDDIDNYVEVEAPTV